MRIRLAILLGVVALLASPATVFAHAIRLKIEVTTYEVRVEVKYDGADHGGSGPTVTLSRLPGKEVVETKPTDKAGVAVFAKPSPGKYLVAAGDEFHDATKEITVTDGDASYSDEPANRWLMIAVGIAAIGGLTFAGWYFSKTKAAKVS